MGVFVGQLVEDLSPTMARPWPSGCGIVNHATKEES